MKPELELCREVEGHIQAAENALLEVKPDIGQRCEARLNLAIQTLQRLAMTPRANRNPEFLAGVHKISRAARRVRLQAQHGSNLCLGLMQLAGDSGYSADGSPLLAPPRAQMSWEA
jgi:hypothetical protein